MKQTQLRVKQANSYLISNAFNCKYYININKSSTKYINTTENLERDQKISNKQNIIYLKDERHGKTMYK